MKTKYPQGKLNENDEGRLLIRIITEDTKVILDFGKELSWIGLDKVSAMQLANAIIETANSIVIN